MKIKSQRDFVSGLLFIAIGVVCTVSAASRPMGNLARPDAGYVPLLLSVLLTVLGAVLMFKSLTIETEGGDPIGAIAWRPLVAVLASIGVFGASLERFGLILATLALVAIASLGVRLRGEWLQNRRNALGLLAQLAVLTLLAWFFAARVLKLAVPIWPVAAGG